MRRAFAWALLALSLASPSEARQKWISPRGNDGTNCVGTGTPYPGADSLHAFKTFFCALCNLSHDDTLRCAPGTYSDGIVNRQYCGLNTVTIIGDSLNPDACIVPGINLDSQNQYYPIPNVTVIGVRVNGSCYVSEQPGNVGSTAEGFNIRRCNIRDEFGVTDANFAMTKVRVGYVSGTSSDSSSRFHIVPLHKPVTCKLTDVRAWTGPRYPATWAVGDKAINWWSQFANTPDVWLTIEATRCSLRVYGCDGWVNEKPFGIHGPHGCNFESCIFELVDSTGTNALAQGILTRDYVTNNVWNNCHFITRTVRAGTSGAIQRLTSPGSRIQGGGNVWRNSTFSSNIPQAASIGFDWQIQPGDSFYRNVVTCSTAVNRGGFIIHNTVGQAYVGHNDFYNRGTGGALMVNDDGDVCGGQVNCCWTGKLTLRDNIMYSRSTGTTSNDYSAGIEWPSNASATNWIDSDYNLYAHYGSSTGARSLSLASCGNLTALYKPGSGAGTAYEKFGLDQHSIYGSPQFLDTLVATFDPILLATSAAIGMASDGGSIGAYEFDRTRPYQIQDLSIARAFPNGVTLAWSATGNDSLTGKARSYDIRYSETPLSESTWSTATQVTGEPTPAISGSFESMTITGLTSGVLYYFGIKASDGPNASVLGGPVSGLLPSSGPEVESP